MRGLAIGRARAMFIHLPMPSPMSPALQWPELLLWGINHRCVGLPLATVGSLSQRSHPRAVVEV